MKLSDNPFDPQLLHQFSQFRQLEINNPPILRRIFVCLRSCCVGRIAGYVTEATRAKTEIEIDKKASKVGGLFISNCLTKNEKQPIDSRALFYQLNQPSRQETIPWAFSFISNNLIQIEQRYSEALQENISQLDAIKFIPIPSLPNSLQSKNNFNHCIFQSTPILLTQLSWLQKLFQISTCQTHIATELLSFYLKVTDIGKDENSLVDEYQSLLLATHNKIPILYSAVYSQQSSLLTVMVDFAATQLALSHCPRLFFPEILGFTLAYCQLPTIPEVCFDNYPFPTAYFKRRKIKIAQHLPILLNCINQYLDEQPLHKQDIVLRIKQGFWLYYDKTLKCRNSFLESLEKQASSEQKIATIFQKRSFAAKGHHQNIQLDGVELEQWFSGMPNNLPQFLTALKNSSYINSHSPAESQLLKLFDFKGPMFGVLNKTELTYLKQWILAGCNIEDVKPCKESTSTTIDLQAVTLKPVDSFTNLSNRKLYYYLINADLFPDVLPIARKKLIRIFRLCSFFNPRPFKHYSHSQFNTFIHKIYQQEITAYQPLKGKPKFTKAAYIWGMEQMAPLILIDGCWLQNCLSLQQTKSKISDLLFQTYCDELGNGKSEQNHATIFQQLLESLSINTPAVYSKAFIAHPEFIKQAFDIPVYMLALSQFSTEYLPELLGLNMAIELSGLGKDYMTLVDELNYWGIDPTIATLHISIDNFSSGHTLLAKQAIQNYMDEVIQNANNQVIIDQHWQRIYTGYSSLRFVGGSFKLNLPVKFLIYKFKQQ